MKRHFWIHDEPNVVGEGLTNDMATVEFLMTSEFFKDDCYFFHVDKYLGPPDTLKEKRYGKIKSNISLEKGERV